MGCRARKSKASWPKAKHWFMRCALETQPCRTDEGSQAGLLKWTPLQQGERLHPVSPEKHTITFSGEVVILWISDHKLLCKSTYSAYMKAPGWIWGISGQRISDCNFLLAESLENQSVVWQANYLTQSKESSYICMLALLSYELSSSAMINGCMGGRDVSEALQQHTNHTAITNVPHKPSMAGRDTTQVHYSSATEMKEPPD